MPQKNSDQREGITPAQLLAILEQSGRPNVTKRTLTQWRSEGLLPPLQRIALPGSKKPVYLWGQEAIEQAMCLYDVIERGTPHRQLLLALWLRGYSVPFEPLLQHWLQSINTLLQQVTPRAQDPDEAVDEMNALLLESSAPRLKFSPRPDQFIRDLGVEAWIDLMTVLFGMLAVPSYKPDEMTYGGILRVFERINEITPSHVEPQEMVSWLLFLQEVFLLPQYKETLTRATAEEWTQARNDYLTLCQFLHTFAALFPRRNARLTPEMREALFLHWGSILPPLLLAVRRAGYGDWVEHAFAFLGEFLYIFDDPDFRAFQARL
jgi:hypothetical protein